MFIFLPDITLVRKSFPPVNIYDKHKRLVTNHTLVIYQPYDRNIA